MKKKTGYTMAAAAIVIGVTHGYVGSLLLGPPRAGTVRNANLQVGDKAPDFRLPDHTGGYVRLSDYVGKNNVVIAFYPLAWTPV